MSIFFAKSSYGNYNFCVSLGSVASLVFSWNQVWLRLHTLLLRLGCLPVAEADHINHACQERVAWTNCDGIHHVYSVPSLDLIIPAGMIHIFSVIMNEPQNFGCNFRIPLPSSVARFLVDSHTLSSTENASGFLDLLVYSAIMLFCSTIRSSTKFVVSRISSRNDFADGLRDGTLSIGAVLGWIP